MRPLTGQRHSCALISLAVAALGLACARAPATRSPAAAKPTSRPAARNPLDALVRAAAEHGFAGNVLVRRHDRELLFDSVGLASEELGVPHRRATRFKVHSTTKPLTAAAVLLLVGDGKLDLEQPMSAVLPGLPATWRAITVRQLLQHTSGIPPEIERVWLEAWDTVDSGSELDVLAAAAAKFPDRVVSRPGETWAYSNMGYTLLGCIVARQSKMSFAQFVHDRVFEPAGMRDSVFDAQAPIKHDMYSGNAVTPRLASGYNGELGQLETTYSKMYTERGAGGLITTADDLARFAAALWTGSLLRERERAMVFDHAFVFNAGTDRESRYGLGWVERRRGGHRIVSHDGGNNGFVADLELWPDDGVVIVAVSNHGFYEGIAALVQALAKLALASP
jgi:D-alanyl-D-alanine carboxypeptidase